MEKRGEHNRVPDGGVLWDPPAATIAVGKVTFENPHVVLAVVSEWVIVPTSCLLRAGKRGGIG